MKRRELSDKDLLSSCSEIGPDDSVDPRTFLRDRSGKKTNRKALQLCGEVAKTLSYALAWEMGDDLLSLLQVNAVVPAPNCARLLVTVSLAAPAEGEVSSAQVLERLGQVKGRLRALVAAAVHRRRVPDLAFQFETRTEWRP